MIVSETPNRVSSRWLQVCVLLCAILVVPFPVAYAQDFDAVERRLGQGVAEGELTLKQAAAMMDALRRTGGAKPDRARQWLMKVRKELGAAVEAGKISREDAAKRFAAAEKAIRERMAAGRKDKDGAGIEARLEAAGARLKAAVKAGKMSEKEAWAKWEAIKKGAQAKDDRGDDRGERARVDAYLRGVWAKLQAAVKAGKMSEEDAHKKMGQVKRNVAARLKNRGDGGDDRADRDPDKGGRAKADAYLRAVWAKLQAAVKAGKMSEEDAHKKMGAIKREVFSRLKNRGGRGPQSKAVPETPVLRRGVSPQEASVRRYQNKDYRRASAIQALREIVDLPTALADDLAVLARRATAAAKVVPNVGTEGYHVKYYGGVHHPHHGLLAQGVGEFSSRPSAGVYFAEHCFDQDGKLAKVIANLKDGTRFVSRTFLYEGDLPSGMLTFGPNGYSFADHGLYKEGRLRLVARFDPDGSIMSCECVFHTGDREDYIVRYVASRRSAQFAVSDLHLNALYLKGSSYLQFNKSGQLTAVSHYYPPKSP